MKDRKWLGASRAQRALGPQQHLIESIKISTDEVDAPVARKLAPRHASRRSNFFGSGYSDRRPGMGWVAIFIAVTVAAAAVIWPLLSNDAPESMRVLLGFILIWNTMSVLLAFPPLMRLLVSTIEFKDFLSGTAPLPFEEIPIGGSPY